MKIAAWLFACLVASGCVTDETDDQDSVVEEDPCIQTYNPKEVGTDVVASNECPEPQAYDSNGDMTPDSPFP